MKIKYSFCLVFASLFIGGCSPFYVIRAAYEQSKILWNREDIQKVLDDPTRPEDERKKLALVLAARQFAIDIGLTPGESYTKYADVHKDALAWIVAASKQDSFTLHTWWFPIVGQVPYKGYFDKPDADKEAKVLEAEDYETWVRPTETLSTLGWFNDPVLSTTLKNNPVRVANTVIHETLHRTVWIRNHVDFNESLANFVGGKGAAQFFAQKAASFTGECDAACATAKQIADIACLTFQQDLTLASGIETLYADLDRLYLSTASRDEKLAQRAVIFDRDVATLKQKFPRITVLTSVNNAEIIQLKLYMTKLMQFELLYRKVGRSWPEFLNAIRDFAKATADDPTKDPFQLLSESITTPVTIVDAGVCQ